MTAEIEILRRASALIRERFEREDVDDLNEAEFHLAVADLLDEAADAFDSYMAKQADPLRKFNGVWLAEAQRKHERALTVARKYLGELA